MFNPIAIIGQSCIVPGALTPQQLWDNILEQRISVTEGRAGEWRMDPNSLLTDPNDPQPDLTWTTHGGYIRGFDSVFSADGFKLATDEIQSATDPIKWLLHVGREAIHHSGYSLNDMAKLNSGAIVGNLSYPSRPLCEYAESVWLDEFPQEWLNESSKAEQIRYPRDPRARFMSGLPAHMLAQGLGLNGRAYALDAACASSLYAIKLACDKLQEGSADVMLAGGLSAADHLVIHMGFCAFQAMSRNGQCKPFHQQADGLIPGEGAGILVLKRLEDAVADCDTILAVIRGVGLSNDGSTNAGFLAPSEAGQTRALLNAYEMSGLSPDDISWIECHATGTTVGDSIELQSMANVFKQTDLSLGALKGQIGHLMTASGVPAISKVISAMQHGIKPPSLQLDTLLPELATSQFELQTTAQAWNTDGKLRRAGINNFGFGGNNAHLILEEWHADKTTVPVNATITAGKNDEIAIVGIGVMAAGCKDTHAFSDALLNQQSQLQTNARGELWGSFSDIDLDINDMRFAPNDLKKTLGQQLSILKVAGDATAAVKGMTDESTSVFIGMQCDTEVARPVLMWRFPAILTEEVRQSPELMQAIKSVVYQSLTAADSVGTMPNIVTNRINSQHDYKGPSFSVSSEELSGLVGIELASRALRKGEIDTALVGAVDLCCEEVHIAAAKKIFADKETIAGDAAVVLVLQRLSDAKAQGNTIYATLAEGDIKRADCRYTVGRNKSDLARLFGHSHTASGLLHVAAAALQCQQDKATHVVSVDVDALGGQRMQFHLHKQHQLQTPYLIEKTLPLIACYAGEDRKAVLNALKTQQQSKVGPARLVLVAETQSQLEQLQQRAVELLQQDGEITEQSICFYEKPIEGDVAFVFPGSTTTYKRMGFDLISAFPQLLDDAFVKPAALQVLVDQVYDLNYAQPLSCFEELKTSSLLCQFHAVYTQKILGLRPQATIGCSSGESNALVALHAWRDGEDLFSELDDEGIYTQYLAGDYDVLKTAWKDYNVEKLWTTWRVRGDVKALQKAVNKEPLLHITIINSPTDCILGGEKQAGDRLLKSLKRIRAVCLGASLMVHTPDVNSVAALWRELHHRQTFSVGDVDVYSAAKGDAYAVTRDSAADALVGQFVATIDFPRVVNKAWENGVRIFIEHGPRGLSTGWIKEILAGKKHLALALDVMGTSSLMQAAYTTGHLLAAGVDVDVTAFATHTNTVELEV